MSIRIDGTNTTANPGITGGDADTGLQFGTDEVSIVTGGTEQVKVDSSGRLLVGTSSALSASSPANASVQIVGRANSSTDEGRLAIARGEPATKPLISGNIIGRVFFTDNVGNEFATIGCHVDNTSGSGDYPGRLAFSTTADGASSPTECVRIDSNGILSTRKAIGNSFFSGTTTDLRVFSNTGSNAGAVSIESSCSSTSTRVHITFSNPNGIVGSVRTSGSSTSYNTSSDYRLKENIVPVADGITRLQQLKPSRFNFIAEPDTVVDGFIAHEVQDIVPEAISGEKDAVNENGDPEYQSIDQSKLVPLLTAALQEAIAKIETQGAAIAALEAKVAALEANP